MGNPENIEAIERGLKNTLYSICIEVEEQIIGYGRIVGDGGFTLHTRYYRVTFLSEARFRQYNNDGTDGVYYKYLSARKFSRTHVGKGKEDFYKKFGFVERPNEGYGAGMIQYLTKP